jgi:hypothetical protein
MIESYHLSILEKDNGLRVIMLAKHLISLRFESSNITKVTRNITAKITYFLCEKKTMWFESTTSNVAR